MSETPDTHHADHADHAARTDVGDAFRQSIPVMLGYVPLGIVFGFLFVQAGGAPWLAVVSSILIYGGAVQYMMVPMLAAGASVASVAAAGRASSPPKVPAAKSGAIPISRQACLRESASILPSGVCRRR